MSIDPGLLPALEQELVFAKQVAPGGQKTDPGRIAAIEEQIKLYKNAESKADKSDDSPSNASTDYESHDADKSDDKSNKVKAAKTRAAAEVETADPKETREDADV